MGLDSYLSCTKSFYSGHSIVKPETRVAFEKIRKAVNVPLDLLDEEFPSIEVSCGVAYWRKANAIHAWFVRECQNGNDDCRRSHVPREKLKTLRDLCVEITNEKSLEKRYEMAEKNLPTQDGFFFGGTGYDEWYWAYLEYTAETLTKILESNKLKGHEFFYSASW